MLITLFTLFGFILGASLGSFAKVVSDRSVVARSFLGGRSCCPSCHHPLSLTDLIPIVSYLFLAGRCRYCRKPIGREYLVVEMLMGVAVAALFWQVMSQLTILSLADLVFKIFVMTILTIVALTDLKKNLIPDKVIIPALWTTLIYLVLFTIYKIGYLYYHLNQTEVGRLLLPPNTDYFPRHASLHLENLALTIGTGLMIGLFFLSLVVVTKRRGMGGGDVKLGGFLGLSLGFPLGLVAIMLAFFTGAVVGLGLIIGGKKRFGQTIPFGPFLSLGGLVVIFWGPRILDWYLSLRLI